MKNLKEPFLLCFIGLLSLYSSKVQAQNIPLVTPSNVTSVADQIEMYLGSRLNISTTKIVDFYLEHWEDATYSELQVPPEGSPVDSDNQSISFEWNPVSLSGSPTITLVGYLSLSDETSMLGENTIQNDITLNIPNDLYLFTFQTTTSSNERSNLFSIIIEKPVLGVQDKDCNCKHHNLVWSSSIEEKKGGNVTSDSYEWAPLTDQEEYYYCVLDFDFFPDASFRSRIIFDGDTPSSIGINGSCMENIRLNDDGTLLEAFNEDIEEQVLGTIGFVVNNGTESQLPEFTYFASSFFNPNMNTGTVNLYRCVGKKGESGKARAGIQNTGYAPASTLAIKELSHSFNAYKQVQYSLAASEKISISLYDSFGRMIKQIKQNEYTDAGTHHINIDLAYEASGFYICVLKTETEMVNVKLLRTP